ncbi:uncharacterized protein LOC144654023 [Oculina patagonica]
MAAFPFAMLFKYTALVALLAFSLVAVSDGCASKSDCGANQVCCNYRCVYGSSCVNRSCSSDSSCSSGESCCNKKCVYGSSCVGQSCSSDSDFTSSAESCWVYDCSSGESCCRRSCVSISNCVGLYCSTDDDCSSGESCCNSECVYASSCVGQSCSSYSDCSNGEIESCCSRLCLSRSTCVGQYCSSDSDCSSGESCCNGECKYSSDCFGYSCSSNSDCGSWESCCNGKCQYSSDDCIDSTAAVIAGAVIGSLVFICAISMCIFFVHRRQRTIRYGRVIEGQRVTATTVTTAGANVQSNPPHPGQVIPPSYSYPYYPPLQFEHQQHTINPPPYNPGTMAASEQPPPYTEVPQGGSGGVDAPKTSFPSAAPVLQQHWES